MKKLSKTQNEVIEMMKQGYEFHCGFFEGCYLKNGNEIKEFKKTTIYIYL